MAEQPITSAFRFPPEVVDEINRRRGNLSKTAFLIDLIMQGSPLHAPLEYRLIALEERMTNLETRTADTMSRTNRARLAAREAGRVNGAE